MAVTALLGADLIRCGWRLDLNGRRQFLADGCGGVADLSDQSLQYGTLDAQMSHPEARFGWTLKRDMATVALALVCEIVNHR
jgi:hypothetical protein